MSASGFPKFLSSWMKTRLAGKLMCSYNQVGDFQNPYPQETGQDSWEIWCVALLSLIVSKILNPQETGQDLWESWCVAFLTSAPRSSTRPWFFPIGWTWFIFLNISFVCDKNMLNRLCTWDLEFRVKYNN